VVKGGTNFEEEKNLQFADYALYPAGPVNKNGGVYVPTNVLLSPMSELVPLDEVQKRQSQKDSQLNRKRKRYFKTYYGREFEDGLGYYNTLSTLALPFNVIESTVTTGYNKAVVDRVSGGIEITNIHNDVYGPDMEKPMQGRFTEHNVGGRQSRHIALNTGNDTYLTRPEAWKILLGTCTTIGDVSGAIGMVGPDYPYPEANAVGANPYPMTGAQKAVYYRDFVAKRPVNIRNISQSATLVLGNYAHNYEVVQSVGTYENPRQFIKNNSLLTLPTQITQTPSASQARTYLDLRRTAEGHFEFIPDYSIRYMSGAKNSSVFKGRFAAHPGIDVTSPGYTDIRSMEYSVYNAMKYRLFSVVRPYQLMSGTVSEPTGVGTPGIRVSDVNGLDFGLRWNLTQHARQFGRANTVINPGATYAQNPSFIKINRNPRLRLLNDAAGNVITSSQYDNFWVQHQIPRSDRQYSWITGAIQYSPSIRYYGYARTDGIWAGYYSSSTDGYDAYFNFITASDVGRTQPIIQPCNSLNYYIIDPVDESSDNNLGLPLTSDNTNYYNSTLLGVYGIVSNLNASADYFNLLMSQRRSAFKNRNIPEFSANQRKVLRKHRANSILTVQRNTRDPLTRYTFKPVTMRGRLARLNVDINNVNTTLCTTYNNEFQYFSDYDLNENCGVDMDAQGYSFEQLMYLCNNNEEYNLNWVLYSEMLFPSKINEFLSGASERVGYDNQYWRASADERYTLGNSIGANSWGITVSQSSWPLDAPTDFLTRTGVAAIDINAANILRGNNRAGELQNEYFHVMSGTFAKLDSLRAPSLVPSALYSRKHLLPQARTVVAASGMQIPETGALSTFYAEQVDPYAGEALWEAGTQAGIMIKSGSITTFQSQSSAPWFSSYDDYKEDLRTVAKDYAIVPEFRISSHVEEYKKLGINANNKFDTFEIVGTNKTSATSSFYKDYSNSEFMGKFADIGSMSGLKPSEIMLVCSASIRFNPYKGFYPAQRTVELVSQFSRSYAESIKATRGSSATIIDAKEGGIRPLMASMFSPGILYNSIKSGIAVDYPIVSDGTKVERTFYGTSNSASADTAWMTSGRSASLGVEGYDGGVFWDYRVPFEAMISPEKYLANVQFIDLESHPSASIKNLTASFLPKAADDIYSLMASNMFSEIGKFFLKDENYTKLESETLTDDLRFKSGSIYGSRIVLKRSVGGIRTYTAESGSCGSNTAYGRWGGRAFDSDSNTFGQGTYALPQDPRQHNKSDFYETFTMYSRPTAFGPDIAGRPTGSAASQAGLTASLTYPADSMIGCNWAFTPPYYNGEAWADLIFTPTDGVAYDLERILSEVKVVYWRCDPGISSSIGFPPLNMSGTQLLPTYKGNIAGAGSYIYDGENVNDNAMQLSASINLFGVERVEEQEEDQFGNLSKSINKTVGQKWVIQPKFETPMLNFNNKGSHPITNADGTLTLPQNYGSGSVPRGMWHQFGVIPDKPDVGIFMEIDDIPPTWLKNHYRVINENSVYNNNKQALLGSRMHQIMKPLTDVIGFKPENRKARLGEIAESRTLREAIVAIPYTMTLSAAEAKNSNSKKQRNKQVKKFFSIDKEKINAAMKEQIGSQRGDSLEASGESIRKMIQKMQRYVLPPQFDFLNNSAVDPIVMYMFEFEYELDQDDLSYIWQNLAPREYETITKTASSVAHSLDNNELLNSEDVVSEDMRWMVFKVKQRAEGTYDTMITSQVGQSLKDDSALDKRTKNQDNYNVAFNWPYDYVSFVETIKFDAQVLYRGQDETTGAKMINGSTSNVENHAHAYMISGENGGNGMTEYAYHSQNQNIKHRHEVVNGVVQSAQSDCYPNCKEAYGVDGVGPHMHAMSEQQVTRTRTSLSSDPGSSGARESLSSDPGSSGVRATRNTRNRGGGNY
jgi:hypothetical protein